MWELDCEESWAPKNWCFWTVVLEKTLESPLDFKEIQPVYPKGDQSWVLIWRTDAEAETSILWLPHGKSWLIGKDPDAGRDWGQEEKRMTEDEMAGWHHWLYGHEFESTLGVCGGQGGLACCDSWGCKESDMTEWLNWLTLNSDFPVNSLLPLLSLCLSLSLSVFSSLYNKVTLLAFQWKPHNAYQVPLTCHGLNSKLCLPRRCWNTCLALLAYPVLLSAGFLGLLPYACTAEEPVKNFTKILRLLPLATSLLGSFLINFQSLQQPQTLTLSLRPSEPAALCWSSISNTELGELLGEKSGNVSQDSVSLLVRLMVVAFSH